MADRWLIRIEAWPHSTGNGADADQRAAGDRVQVFEVIADDMGRAFEKACLIQRGMEAGPMVWRAPIFEIRKLENNEHVR